MKTGMSRLMLLAVGVGLLWCEICVADPWEGAWRDTELNGIGPTPNGECELIALTDRTVRLAKSGEGYEGAWLTASQQRLTRKWKLSCKLERTKSPIFGLNMKVWMLTGKLDGVSGKMKVVGHSSKCTGDWCDDWKEANDTFETTLQLREGRLIDLGTDDKTSTGREFVAELTHQRGSQALVSEMKRLGTLIVNGSCGEFYDGASSLFQKGRSRAQFVTECKDIGSKIESRSFVDNLYITSFSKGTWPLPGPYVLFMNRVATKLGVGVEFVVFARENDSMKLIYWSIQG